MTKTTHISLTEAKQRLGELVKRSAYGGERFVIEFRGKPQAVVMSVEQAREIDPETFDWDRAKQALDSLTALREQIKARVGVLPDSTQLIREMRDEREKHFPSLR